MGPSPKQVHPSPPRSGFNIWLVLLVLIFFLFLQANLFSAKVATISYSQFKEDLATG